MKFSYNWLQSFFGRKLPKPEKLAELLTMHSFEVSETEKFGRDWVLNIDVLPNRAADCLSHIGLAREISALINSKFHVPKLKKVANSKLQTRDFIDVEVQDKRVCQRYNAKVIAHVKIMESPKWLRERLEVCGLRPINNIVDIINYVMLETGQPLHAFDGEKLEQKKIIVRFARPGETIIALDGKKYELGNNILVIADGRKPVGIAGIKGGRDSGISKETKTVILESANFDPQVIRRGSKSIGLKTDASLRFENGLDPCITEVALNRAGALIEQMGWGKPTQDFLDIYPKKILPKRIKLDLNYVKKLLGTEILKTNVLKILKRLEFRIIDSRFNVITIEVPTFRLDISIPEDLVEEVGRIHGYNKIKAVLPIASLVPPKRNLTLFWENFTKDVLQAAGFTEVYNYSFISENDVKVFSMKQSDLVELENPTSREFRYLRPSLLVNLVKNIVKNQRNFDEIKIFELGKVFSGKDEKRMLAGLITGDAFYETKGVVDLLLQKAGISNVVYNEHEVFPDDIWHPKKTAKIKVDNMEIGFLGEISPKILGALKVKNKVAAYEIDFDKLAELASQEVEYRPLSRFPAALRDIAVLVPSETKIQEVLNKIETAGGKLIRDIELFDVYEGEEIADNKKNLAFHLVFQAEDHTLSSGEIEAILNKIIKTLEENPLWQLRK